VADFGFEQPDRKRLLNVHAPCYWRIHLFKNSIPDVLPQMRALFALILGLYFPATSHGQFRDQAAADLTATGEVKAVFRGEAQVLIQIVVESASIPGGRFASGANYPAPGENLYIHVTGLSSSGSGIPSRGESVRVFLKLSSDRQWQAASQDWFTNDIGGGTSSSASEPATGAVLGVSAEPVSIGRVKALKVTLVIPDSPAAKAGLEPGDVIVKADGRPVNSGPGLAEAYRNASGVFTLTVRNVRNGQEVDVQVAPPAMGSVKTSSTSRTERMRGRPLELGLESELAFYQGEAALKITKVAPGSAADRAGISVGLLILQANGKKVENPQQLNEAVDRSPGGVLLRVVDPQNRRETTVQIKP
jgi:hypothetical protein